MKGKKEQDISAYPVTETIHYTLNGEDGFCPECGTATKEFTMDKVGAGKYDRARLTLHYGNNMGSCHLLHYAT